MNPLDRLASGTGFEWNEGNRDKNWNRHRVTVPEAEQVLLNQPLVAHDVAHSGSETRFHALGLTDQGRHLLVVFTIRGTLIRVISARDMSSKERRLYSSS